MSSVQNNTGLTINIYNNTAPPPTGNFPTARGLTYDEPNDTDIDNELDSNNGNGGAFDNLPLPVWAKSALKSLFGGPDSNLPSSSDAAKTLRDFQRDNDIGLLGSEQVQQMADTGYCTMPNGERQLVPEDVQAAAKKMMANNGELFKKLETAIRPDHDGLLSAADYDAALKDGSIGKPGTPDLPTEKGLDMAAFLKFVMDGTISSNRPTEYNAAKTIQGFQQDNNIKHLNIDQIKQMADTGYCTTGDGKTSQVPPDVQAAAQKMMDNNCELFKKLETSIRKEADGLLSVQDVDAADKNGQISKQNSPQFSEDDAEMIADMVQQFSNNLAPRGDESSTLVDRLLALNLPSDNGGNGLPSSSDAVSGLLKFQGDNDIDLLSVDQVKQMADTGYCTLGDGKTIQVSPEAQASAQKAMENNGDLFKKLESAITGDFDGLVSKEDYSALGNKGTVGQPAGNTGAGAGPATKSEYGALDTMGAFQKDVLGDEMLSRDKMQQMATTGKLTKDNGVTIDVPKDVQESAKTMMANNGALFDKLEVAHNGKKDGLVSVADYEPAKNQAIKEAANTIASFQKSELKGDFLTQANMKEIAETGKLTKNDGSVVQVPEQVQAAAKAYMDNDAKLFKDAESWQDNKHDNKLSVKDSEKRAAAAAA